MTTPSTDIFAPTCALVCVVMYVAAYFILLGLRSDRDKQFAELERLRAIEVAAREVAANVEDDIDARLRYVVVQPSRQEWATLKAALAAKDML